MTEILEKVYDPQRIEAKWYEYWEEQGFFHARADGAKPGYCIVIPPPTSPASCTWPRPQQHPTRHPDPVQAHGRLRRPVDAGTDHAGIATRTWWSASWPRGRRPPRPGREAFIKRVWEWKASSGGHIITQLKRLGCSCDWSRERFTLDDGLSGGAEVFVRLYEEGLIYKGDYIINWCPAARRPGRPGGGARPTDGHLYHIKYPCRGRRQCHRGHHPPRDAAGDTAVAVNPEDQRYKKYHGAT